MPQNQPMHHNGHTAVPESNHSSNGTAMLPPAHSASQLALTRSGHSKHHSNLLSQTKLSQSTMDTNDQRLHSSSSTVAKKVQASDDATVFQSTYQDTPTISAMLQRSSSHMSTPSQSSRSSKSDLNKIYTDHSIETKDWADHHGILQSTTPKNSPPSPTMSSKSGKDCKVDRGKENVDPEDPAGIHGTGLGIFGSLGREA